MANYLIFPSGEFQMGAFAALPDISVPGLRRKRSREGIIGRKKEPQSPMRLFVALRSELKGSRNGECLVWDRQCHISALIWVNDC
jgi:hypothetical protein